ncbi:NUDIX hydrolase [Phreatobacter cathodiphilus]|uniref:NUDIX hydrolase n=1 Tax=Phreatobacter cathodiphilus TaxID=1868589 RepID=UPI0015E710AF|nr:NUDIX hydrolase [Phreatobacter cathodiphilus]
MHAVDRRETTEAGEEADGVSVGLGHAGPIERNRLQFAALPYRLTSEGGLEVLLITSRSTRRWIIPKGWPMGKRPAHKVAAQEAAEEAGVEGKIGKRAIGSYHYDKVLASGAVARCRVDVFSLEVKRQNSAWPERKRRERRWMDLAEAAGLIDDIELAPLIRDFTPHRA